jgi:hypothetical protein
MKPIKDFDCVQMKWDIQQELLEEEQQLGKEEARRRRDERVRNDPILGPFLRRVEAYERKKASEKLEQMAGKG